MDGSGEGKTDGFISQRRDVLRRFLKSAFDVANGGSPFSFEAALTHIPAQSAYAALVEIVEADEDPDIRLTAAFVLMNFGEDHPTAIDYIKAVLEGPNLSERFKAAMFLTGSIRLAPNLIPPLSEMLTDSDWFARVAAAGALVEHKPEAIQILGAALRGDSRARVEESVFAHYNLKPVKKTKELADAVDQFAQMLRLIAAMSLARAGLRSTEAVKALVDGIESEDDEGKLGRVTLLGRIGPPAVAALRPLRNLLRHWDISDNVKHFTIQAIGNIAGSDVAAANSLTRALVTAVKGHNWATASVIVSTLSKMGHAPPVAVLAMEKQLGSLDPSDREMAAICLGKLKVHADQVIPALIAKAKADHSYTLWLSISSSLAAIGPPAIPKLLEILNQEDISLMPLAGETLLKIANDSAEHVVHAMLTHPSRVVRNYASRLIQMMEAKARPAVPAMIKLLQAGDEETRLDTVIALSALGPLAAEAAPDLVAALSDRWQDIAQWAETALRKIGTAAIPFLEAARGKAGPQVQQRIEAILADLGPAMSSAKIGPDFEWVGDDLLLEFFVEVARIVADESMSIRELARRLAEGRKSGSITMEVPTNEPTVRRWIERLEKRFSEHERNQDLRLIDRETAKKRKGGLSAYAKQILPRVTEYLRLKARERQI